MQRAVTGSVWGSIRGFARALRSRPGRLGVGLQIVAHVLGTGCGWPGPPAPGALAPRPGLLEYQTPLHLAVPGGSVNLAGGNLVVRRVDLSIDTLLGTREIGAVYNSAAGAWRWSFEMRYDGSRFVDESGAEHDLAGVAPGAAVPGTHWVKLDATRVRTKGGLVHEFDPGSHALARIHWADHPRPRLDFVPTPVAGEQRLTAIVQCREGSGCTTVFDLFYDARGCVERIADRAGREARFLNDAACRPLEARDGLDVARGWSGWRYEYDGDALTAATSSEGERVEYAYADGRLAGVRAMAAVGEESPTVLLSYDYSRGLGLYRTSVTDAAGARSEYAYDEQGRLHVFANAEGELVSHGWEGRRPASRTDAAGLTTYWTWQDDDPVEIRPPSGNVVTIVYAPAAQDRSAPLRRPVLRIDDALGVVETRSYYAQGQLREAFDGAGERRGYAYDAEGNLIGYTGPDGIPVSYLDFGDHGHATRIVRADYTVEREYDDVGNLVHGGDPTDVLSARRPGLGRRAWDEDRNLRSVELVGGSEQDPFGELRDVMLLEHRSDGQLRSVTRPYGGDTAHAHDALGRLVEIRERVDGAWATTRIEYDATGRPVAVERPNGMRAETDYDAAGRPIVQRLLRGGQLERSLTTSWLDGRIVERLDTSYAGVERIGYDAAGRPATVVYPRGERLEIDHDLRSRETERRYLSATGAPIRAVGFGWDGADRAVRLLDEGQVVVERVRSQGRVARIDYGNGLRRTFDYDGWTGIALGSRTEAPGERLVEETAQTWSLCAEGRICLSLRTWTYDHAGGLPYTESVEGYVLGPFTAPLLEAGTPGLRLDMWAPVYAPDILWPGGQHQAFDTLGNRIGESTTRSALETRFHYNAERNRLVAAELPDARSYEWDAAGYLVRRDGVEIGWDAGGRIASVGGDLLLEWDVLGRPVRSVVNGAETIALFGGAVRADAGGVPLVLDLGDVRIELAAGERVYRHHDFRGNVKFLTGDAGQVLRHYAYGAWGPLEVHGEHPDDVGFARGRSAGDLLLLGSRVYDPEVGRFVSPDPLRHPVNLHAYTQGNPVMYWDPGGLQAQPTPYTQQEFWLDTADTLTSVGAPLVVIGLTSGNLPLALFGFDLLLAATAIRFSESSRSPGFASPHVDIIDLDTPYQPDAGPSSGSSELAAPETCAPTRPFSWSRRSLLTWLLLPIQLLLAHVALTAWRRRASRRRRSRDD